MKLTKISKQESVTREMKLGLNLAKGAIKVLSTDTYPEVILKNSIQKIDSTLKLRDENLIDDCNGEITAKYRSVFANNNSFCIIPNEVYKELSFVEKFDSLRSMGLELFWLLIKNKAVRVLNESGKAGLEYVVDRFAK